MSDKKLDCIVCGSCVVDLICRPVALDQPIGSGKLHEVDPILITAGGITSNSGVALARLGMSVSIFSYVGNDGWAPVLRDIYVGEGIDDSLLLKHPTEATSTTVVTVDQTGERSFFHCVGAPKQLDKQAVLDNMDRIFQSRFFLLGYYSLMPNLEGDLPELFDMMRKRGVRTGMDAAGTGGDMQPLDTMLPHLDVWVPSYDEAVHQTNEKDPQKIIKMYREAGAAGIVGVKLGRDGVLLSEKADEYVQVDICTPPGDVVDTTGAGDNFYGGFVAGLLLDLPLHDAGKLGAATAACSVTTIGGATGARGLAFARQLAGV